MTYSIEAAVKRLLLIALTLSAPLALADEHLVPEANQFTRATLPNGEGSLAPYYDMVLSLLGDSYTRDVRARVIAMPSYAPEYAVGIRERDGAYAIFRLGLDTNVWRYKMLESLKKVNPSVFDESIVQGLDDTIAQLEELLPEDFQDVGVERCEIAIEPEFGKDILSVWHTMLLQTRYAPSRNVGQDGTDYHFSMPGSAQYLSGKAWEPPLDSDAGRLVSIAETMKNLCITGDANLLRQLRPQVDDMLARLGG